MLRERDDANHVTGGGVVVGSGVVVSVVVAFVGGVVVSVVQGRKSHLGQRGRK